MGMEISSSTHGMDINCVGRGIDITTEGDGMQVVSRRRAVGAITQGDGEIAVGAYAQGARGVGLDAGGTSKGVVANSSASASGVGLEATASNGIAVTATATVGAGLRARGSTFGVIAQSTTTDPTQAALFASANDGMAIGCNTDTGQVFDGTSASGGGMRVDAPKFHLRLTNQANRNAPTSDSFAHTRGDMVETTSGDLWLCTTAGTPGTWRKLGGPATAGAFHVLPTPARVYDSRLGAAPTTIGPKTPFATNTTRVFDLKANSSGVPAGATAALVTLLLVNAIDGAGNLTVWANGATKPLANTLVWGGSAGRFSATTVTALDSIGRVQVNASARTDLVIDVIGYYR